MKRWCAESYTIADGEIPEAHEILARWLRHMEKFSYVALNFLRFQRDRINCTLVLGFSCCYDQLF